jgi:quercetin dioxygenase-like cupin family protein
MSAAQAETVIDDERVRVTKWTFAAAGDDTRPHVHEFDYVVVPVTGGTFEVTAEDGATHDLTQSAGSPYLGSAGTAHNVTSVSGTVVFVEVELKRPNSVG